MLTIPSLITLLILTVRRTCSDSSPEFPLLLYSTAANGCEGRTVVVRGVVLLQVTRLGCRKKGQTLFFFFTVNPRLFILYRNRTALAERALILVSEDTSSKKKSSFRLRVIIYSPRKPLAQHQQRLKEDIVGRANLLG